MSKERPIPSDFAEVAVRFNSSGLRSYYRTGERTITRWFAEAGITPNRKIRCPHSNKLALPADFIERAATENSLQLRRRYNVSDQTIARWRRETGVKTPYRGQLLKPIPDDFAEVAPTMKRFELRTHYAVSEDVLHRWVRESGAKPRHGRACEEPRRSARRQVEKRLSVVMDSRTDCPASRAQTFLQRYGPVYRCDQNGHASPKGAFFYCWGAILEPDALIARAERKGWVANEWQQLARAA